MKAYFFLCFMLIMIALGASDAMRGIYNPVFKEYFLLDNKHVSLIVTISYVGNLIFLLIGGYLADRIERKRVAVCAMLLWIAALLLYLATDNFFCLLMGMFLSMGASTLMNTMINLMTPAFFGGAGAMIINILFFTQGIGTAGSQKLFGTYAQSFSGWKTANILLLLTGGCGTFFFALGKSRASLEKNAEEQKDTRVQRKKECVWKKKAFFYLILIFGFYFVAEHGILNWLTVYATGAFGLSAAAASTCLSLFFGGMTIGRLVFAPVVLRMGVEKSISIFGILAVIIYSLGIFGGEKTILLLGAAGLFLSVIYPTLLMLIQKSFPFEQAGTATGLIISIATVYDIGFNAVFGTAVDRFGYRTAFMVLPLCLILFLCFLFVLLRQNQSENKKI